MKATETRVKLEGVKKPFEDLYARVCDRCTKLQTAQMRSQEFEVSFNDFLVSLKEMEEFADQVDEPSAVYDNTKEQKKTADVSMTAQISTEILSLGNINKMLHCSL